MDYVQSQLHVKIRIQATYIARHIYVYYINGTSNQYLYGTKLTSQERVFNKSFFATPQLLLVPKVEYQWLQCTWKDTVNSYVVK